MNSAKTYKPDAQKAETAYDRRQSYMLSLQFFDSDVDDYLYIYDMAAARVYFTDKIREKFPIPPAGDDGNPFADWANIIYPKDRQYMNYYRNLLRENKIDSFNIAYRILDREGRPVWVNARGTIRENDRSLLVGRISEMAGRVVDGLTGLCTTERFMEDIKTYQTLGSGYLMILGIDNFKSINIAQGRAMGDEILKRVATVLDQNAEYPMGVYRMDGDCFAVIFPGKQQQEIVRFYESLKKDLDGICTVSAGVVSYERGQAVEGDLIYQYGENALDQAKIEGKNRLTFFSSDQYQRNLEQIELLDEMKASVADDFKGFYLCYQPQFNSDTFEIYGVEALLRYDSPSKGKMSPDAFIPLLEQSGLICSVGQWVLRKALFQCRQWRKEIPKLHINVNVSYVQLQQENITDSVLKLVQEAGLPGEALTLEVTESIQIPDYPHFNKIFYAWKQYGIQIAIDDFGTGYSSLSYLKSMEIDEVKIDRCFVDHIQYNAYNYRLINNMIEIAHSAKIEVCCEGVETIEELMALQQLHAERYQGYLFAKPCTEEQFYQEYLCKESKDYRDRMSKISKFRNMEPNENKEILNELQELRKEEISNITESMEEMVFVNDVDTYELHYMNAAGRKMTGVYDYKDCKCYEIMRGRDAPCEFCTQGQICEDKFSVWESYNPFLNRHFILKEKLIPWQGKMMRLGIGIDITHKEIVSKSIQKKLDFEEAIVESCKLIASEIDSEQSSYGVMKIMGEFCKADRTYILKPSPEGELWIMGWEWCAEGIAPLKSSFAVSLEQLQKNKESITAPIMRGNKLIGYVGVDHPINRKDGKDLIKTLAYFLGYSIIGEKTQEDLNLLI